MQCLLDNLNEFLSDITILYQTKLLRNVKKVSLTALSISFNVGNSEKNVGKLVFG